MRGGCFIRRENPMINGFLVRGKVSGGRQSSGWRNVESITSMLR